MNHRVTNSTEDSLFELSSAAIPKGVSVSSVPRWCIKRFQAPLLIIALTLAAHAQLPTPVTRFRAKFAILPQQCHLTYRALIWGEEGITQESVGAQSWMRSTRLTAFPWSETLWADGSDCRDVDSNGILSHPQGDDEKALRTRWRLMSGQWMQDEQAFSALPADAQGNPRVRYQGAGCLDTTLTFDPQGDLSEASFGHIGLRFARWRRHGQIFTPDELSLSWAGLVNPELYQLTEVAAGAAQEPPPVDSSQPLAAGTAQEIPLSLVQDRWTQVPVSLFRARVDSFALTPEKLQGTVLFPPLRGGGPNPTVSGQSLIFLMDSGASDTVIDTGVAEQLGFRRAGQQQLSAGIFKDACWLRSGPIQLGGTVFPESTVLGMDLHGGAFATAFPGVAGILGRDIFARSVVVIDYFHSRLRFVPRESFRPEPDDRSIACRSEGPGLALKVEVGDQPGYFTLDTGSGSGVLVQHLPGQERWLTAHDRALRDPQGASFGSGTSATWPGRADFKVGPFLWKAAPLRLVDEASARGASLLTQGNVGVGYLRHFRVSIDLTGGRLWLAQERPFRQAGAGLLGLHTNGTPAGLLIISLVPQGPAQRAGLRQGDVILKINGGTFDSNAAGESFAEAQPGEVFDLQVLRAGKTANYRIKAVGL